MKIKRAIIERDAMNIFEGEEGKVSINPNDMQRIDKNTKEAFLKAKQI